ncbi:signal peptidase I [Microbacterium sp. 22242]|uniref:signal peptidase I n=1 Tax=Microbacterium sp. 22242 TaxID=3453896 RepID=UPI003F87D202
MSEMTRPTSRREARRGAPADGRSHARVDAGPEAPAEKRAAAGADASGGGRRRPTARGVLSEILLWIVALAGLVCIVLVILAFTAHITLIMFRTGSMAPTIPTGSVAIVQQIPASQVHVGDVVTVDRPGELPVTHRVRAVADGSVSGERLLTLRGDANAQDDVAPYPVSTVRIVRFSVPGLAPVIVAFGNPLVLGGITIGVTALVVWAFWPRGRGSGGRDGSDEAPAAEGERSDAPQESHEAP